jgi:hypothetical protein
MRSHFLLGTLAVLLVACRAADRPPAGAQRPGAPVVDPGSVAGRFALELWQLRGVSLGEWRAAHPEDALIGDDSSGTAAHMGSWCAESVHDFEARGRVVQRRAYFYPPPPPTILAPPDSALDLARGCLLGAVWVSTSVASATEGARVADSVRARLDTVFGGRRPGTVAFFGSAYWSVVGRYGRDSVIAVSALQTPPLTGPRADSAPLRRVLAFAFLPLAGVSVEPGALPADVPYTPPDTLPLDSALALAGLDTALSAPLLRATRAAAEATRMPGPPDSLVRPLARWMAASAPLPTPRRAAALYVADRVLDRALCAYRMCELQDSAALRPLQTLGARFSFSPLGGAWVYGRSWLVQARALDRDAPLGQRILLQQLAAGFDFSGTCHGGVEAFRAVIANGERYLERAPDSPVATDVHFLVAEAYRDVVALAAGAGDIYADSSRYSGEAGAAGRSALAHYTAAIASGAGGPTARAAWRRAWWLRAGLLPRGVRFLCIYD